MQIVVTFWTLLAFLFAHWPSVIADTPADCRFEDVVGIWHFRETAEPHKNANCSEMSEGYFIRAPAHTFQLFYPNVVVDHYNKQGTWTLIYNQGFEIRVNNRVYFAFFKWMTNESQNKVVSICHETLPGWAHDIYGNDKTCFFGFKSASGKAKIQNITNASIGKDNTFENDAAFVNVINQRQNLWKASTYDQTPNSTNLFWLRQTQTNRNFLKRRSMTYPRQAQTTEELSKAAAALPDNFDWRNVSGVNYVSPVRDQRNCGSCYAFASTSAMQSRYRILSNNEQKPIFSPQDIVDCSVYAQGCDGGFPYLIAGKYMQDNGFVLERCYPYVGQTQKCNHTIARQCDRYYATDYKYIGGYYGACNSDLMKLALFHRGPIVVGFNVFRDFYYYRSGIYQHSGNHYNWDPFLEVTHAVTIVGYGVDKASGKKYWTVQNSWGLHWGENGYFRILRDHNECGIESLAVESTPILRSQ